MRKLVDFHLKWPLLFGFKQCWGNINYIQETNFVHYIVYHNSHKSSLQPVSALYDAFIREYQTVIVDSQRTEGGS
jgi:hypothetical protein